MIIISISHGVIACSLCSSKHTHYCMGETFHRPVVRHPAFIDKFSLLLKQGERLFNFSWELLSTFWSKLALYMHIQNNNNNNNWRSVCIIISSCDDTTLSYKDTFVSTDRHLSNNSSSSVSKSHGKKLLPRDCKKDNDSDNCILKHYNTLDEFVKKSFFSGRDASFPF